jgi:hypothetical protein
MVAEAFDAPTGVVQYAGAPFKVPKGPIVAADAGSATAKTPTAHTKKTFRICLSSSQTGTI